MAKDPCNVYQVDTSTKLVDFPQQPNGTGIVAVFSKIYSYETIGQGEPMVWSYDVSTTIFESNVIVSANNNDLGYNMSNPLLLMETKLLVVLNKEATEMPEPF